MDDVPGYRWEVKKIEEPGKPPRYQAHLVPTEESKTKMLMEQAMYMEELKTKGYITLPPELATRTGFRRWVPSDQAQTQRVLAEMGRDD